MNYLVFIHRPLDMMWAMTNDPWDGKDVELYVRRRQPEVDLGKQPNNVAEMGSFMVKTERQANLLANILAKQHPTWEIYISKCISVVSAKTPEIVTKQVSEKGVLPV